MINILSTPNLQVISPIRMAKQKGPGTNQGLNFFGEILNYYDFILPFIHGSVKKKICFEINCLGLNG